MWCARSASGPNHQRPACRFRTRRTDSARIVRETVHALEGLAMSVELADPAGLDPAQATEWATSMTRSLRALSTFARQIKESLR